MTKDQLIRQCSELFINSLNPNSKWYQQDICSFKAIIKTKSVNQLKQQLASMRGIMGLDEQTNSVIAAEERKLERAGMYNIGNMKPENSLD